VLRELGIERFHLVGHSMGGLTALLLASQEPSPVLSFIDIEGNVAPQPCPARCTVQPPRMCLASAR
jgi:pimeloyl-ACP methyl ester carboxylesterase